MNTQITAQENFIPTVIDKIKETVKDQLNYCFTLPDLSGECLSTLVGLQKDLFAVFAQYKEETTEETSMPDPATTVETSNLDEKEVRYQTTIIVRLLLEKLYEMKIKEEDSSFIEAIHQIECHLKKKLPVINTSVEKFDSTGDQQDLYVLVRRVDGNLDRVSRIYTDLDEAQNDTYLPLVWRNDPSMFFVYQNRPILFDTVFSRKEF